MAEALARRARPSTMRPVTARLRDLWFRGGTALNAWVTFRSPSVAALLGSGGFDAVTVDLQHGEASLADLGPMVAAIELTGAAPFARVRWNDPGAIMRALDLGARGVICPMVNAAAEAESFVRACRYPPLGVRSYGPVRAAFGSGREHAERANEATLAFAQIETEQGLAAVEEISSTEGLDGLYVGPADLSLALGLADLRDPALLDALDRIVAAARRNGLVPGIHAPSIDRAIEMGRRGFRFIGSTGDAELLAHGARANLESIRAELDRT
jgi:4-hydroxy-2-oxoheptanedioate aldolase